jgi:hypothetical protein
MDLPGGKVVSGIEAVKVTFMPYVLSLAEVN